MRLSRRTFLKLAGTAAGSVALTGLWGCANGAANSGAGAVATEGAEGSGDAGASTNSSQSAGDPSNADTSADGNASARTDATSEPADTTDTAPEKEQTMSQNDNAETAAQPADEATSSASNAAVVYFSCTGNTQAVAEKVAAAADADLLRLEPAEPYTSADLNYNSDCRANAEQDSVTDRPAVAQPAPDVSAYDIVYLGYPIWWGKVPRVVLTYLESIDLVGKTVVPFCTSGSSGIGGSLDELHAAASSATWHDGSRFASSASQSEIDSWVSSL